MVKLDGHIQLLNDQGDIRQFADRLHVSGIGGGIVISQPPPSFPWMGPPASLRSRLDGVLKWSKARSRLYPFFWIDPLEPDAIIQVEIVIEEGIEGFMIVCDRFYPGDERVMPVLAKIVENKKPILFHSGILRDSGLSSKYSRPIEFEVLFKIPGLRFALSNLGWPWTDELIALFGKFMNASHIHAEQAVEMFLDITPAGPPEYRREHLFHLFNSEYDAENRVFFGSGCLVHDYDPGRVKKWLDLDRIIFDEIGLSNALQTSIYLGNLRRFIGTASSN